MARRPDSSQQADADVPAEEAAEALSKSARKREMTARQTLGEALCELSARELARIPIEDSRLLTAIDEASRINSRSALRRHRQYIGKLMRDVDPRPLQRALDLLYQEKRGATREFHELEALRDQLRTRGDDALADVIKRFPEADRQQLRQLVREAQREATRQSPSGSGTAGAGKSSRRLFRYLRELQEQRRGTEA